jgi:hypothetical protein
MSASTTSTKRKPALRSKTCASPKKPAAISAQDWEKLKAAELKALKGLVVLRRIRGDTVH